MTCCQSLPSSGQSACEAVTTGNNQSYCQIALSGFQEGGLCP
jgi:hypothetical protein